MLSPRNWLKPLRRLAFPDLCLACNTRIEGRESLCAQCWRGIAFFLDGYVPATVEQDGNGPERVRSVMAYENTAMRLVSRYKYSRRMECAPVFARWMSRAGADILAEADMLIAVPMHPWRLLMRGFNQTIPVAQGIARISGVPMCSHGPYRAHLRHPQVSLSGAARAANIAGAFRMRKNQRAAMAGKNIIVIDDVFTSGATVRALTSCLKRAGAKRVDALTLARVV